MNGRDGLMGISATRALVGGRLRSAAAALVAGPRSALASGLAPAVSRGPRLSCRGCSLSTPSTTTTSPAARPLSITVWSPSLGPIVDLAQQTSTGLSPARRRRRTSSPGRAARPPSARSPRRARLSTSSRALTNWLGNSMLSSFSNIALSRTVPVVASTWLSMAISLPVASLVLKSRS